MNSGPLWGGAPGSEVSRRTARCASRRNMIPLLRRSLRLEHRVLQLGFCQQLLEPCILLILQDEPFGLFDLHPTVLLSAVVRWLRQVDQAVVVGDRLALGDKLLHSFELADDLLRCVHGAFHGGVSSPVCPDKGSHSPWTDKMDHVTTTTIANSTTAGKMQTKSRHKV